MIYNNIKSMKEIFKQLRLIWQEMKGVQKGASFAVLVAVAAALCFVLMRPSSHSYVPLFANKVIPPAESEALEAYLIETAIPYKIDPDKGVLVQSDQVDQAKAGLGSLQKPGGTKGFELFDTNTWIKGEKELQVLEMRALKGQLEKDLAAFENIKSASVILDIPPQKSFNGSKFQTKASVILTLMPKARLSSSQLRAITNHLSGAVRGLEPQMIAISDSTGKLYKSIDPQHGEDSLQDPGRQFEERVEEKIGSLLNRLVGEGHFHTTVQAVLTKGSHEVESLSIAVIIDTSIAGSERDSFRKEIERQLFTVAKGYNASEPPTIDFIPFDKKVQLDPVVEKGKSKLGIIFTLLFVAIALAACLPLLRTKKKKKGDEEALFNLMTRVDVKKLAASIGNEDPQTIALMLSYLEPAKAEQMIAALAPSMQEEVLLYLAELEKESAS